MKNKFLSFVLIGVLAIALLLLKRCKGSADAPVPPPASGTASAGQPRGLNRNIDLLYYSKHARCRMQCRDVSQKEVEAIFQQGKINYRKSDLENSLSPTYAVEGITTDGQRVRIVVAQKKTQTTVVTVIDLENEWACPSCN